MGGIGGDTYDGDTRTLSGCDINVVVARTAQGDQTHPVVLEVLDELCVYVVIDEDTDDLHTLGEADVIEAKVARIVLDIEAVLLIDLPEGRLVVGHRTEEGYAYL